MEPVEECEAAEDESGTQDNRAEDSQEKDLVLEDRRNPEVTEDENENEKPELKIINN
jgi:hypothetical protein